jgi:N-methylhydantoinase A
LTEVKLAIDIGGTFTDVALEHGENRWTTKVLTTPARPEEGVISGIEDVLNSSGVASNAVSLLIHGTTLATNAIIERKGAPTALITTDGFRDILEIGYESRYNQYDIMIEKAVPLVPRHLRLPVVERMDVHGQVLTEIDESSLKAHIPTLQSGDVESIAIGFPPCLCKSGPRTAS